MFCYNDFHFEDDSFKKIDSGKNIINKIHDLSKELYIVDELSLCNLYAYLLHTGNLSINRSFKYDANNVLDDGFYNLMLGYGCCRNISSGLKKVLNKADVKNAILTTSFKETLFSKDEEFHSINLIVEKDKYFIYDITNMHLFKITPLFLKSINNKKFKLKVINIKQTFNNRVYYPYQGSVYDGYEKDFDFKPISKELKTKDIYSLEEYLTIYEKDISDFKDSKTLINDFYSDIKEDINIICKCIKKESLV